jgi:thiol-disulfide isomerase/thioredoxin
MTQRPDAGIYMETFRSYFMFEDIVGPFLNTMTDKISIKDSINVFCLTRQMNEQAVRRLHIDKNSYLPINSTSVIWDKGLGLQQIISTDFIFDQAIGQVSDSTFSPEHYISKGYVFQIVEEANETESESKEKSGDLLSGQKLLFDYQYVSDAGDTVSLPVNDAAYILLDFWFASCLPCLEAMPEINAMAIQYAAHGLNVIAMNCFDLGIRESLVSKLREKKITMPILFAKRDLTDALGISRFPTYLLIHPDRATELIYGGVAGVQNTLERIFGK